MLMRQYYVVEKVRYDEYMKEYQYDYVAGPFSFDVAQKYIDDHIRMRHVYQIFSKTVEVSL